MCVLWCPALGRNEAVLENKRSPLHSAIRPHVGKVNCTPFPALLIHARRSFISVIKVSDNCAAALSRSLKAVANQDYSPIVHIVVDGAGATIYRQRQHANGDTWATFYRLQVKHDILMNQLHVGAMVKFGALENA
jgi:hypothetical protein